MIYRTYRIEQSAPSFWVVTDPNRGEQCMAVFETRRQAREFVDELLAAAGRGIARAMREMRDRRQEATA